MIEKLTEHMIGEILADKRKWQILSVVFIVLGVICYIMAAFIFCPENTIGCFVAILLLVLFAGCAWVVAIRIEKVKWKLEHHVDGVTIMKINDTPRVHV